MRAKEFLGEAGTAWSGDAGYLGKPTRRKDVNPTGTRKSYINPDNYSEARRKLFQKWVTTNKLEKIHRNVLFDLKGDPQDTVVYHPPGSPKEIWAYERPVGSVASSAPMRMVRKDIAPPGLLY